MKWKAKNRVQREYIGCYLVNINIKDVKVRYDIGWSRACSGRGPELSVDENLLRLALLARFNCFKVANYTAGRCSALMCRPPKVGREGRLEVQVVGFGINAPPRFGVGDPTAGIRPWSRKEPPQNEIHSEMQVMGRCAREGISMKGCWFYVALPPCWECCKALVAAGVARVLFKGAESPFLDRFRRKESGHQ